MYVHVLILMSDAVVCSGTVQVRLSPRNSIGLYIVKSVLRLIRAAGSRVYFYSSVG